MTTLPSTNTAWGFWGTIARHADPATAWPLAMTKVSEATGLREAAVRTFLDTRHGRYFADEVTNHLAAGQNLETSIGTAVETWMSWIIGPCTAHATGFPEGQPYLTALIGRTRVGVERDTGPWRPETADTAAHDAASQGPGA